MDGGVMDGQWSDVDDDGDEDPPPNPHPGRVPEWSFWFRIAVSDGGGAAEVFLGKTPSPRYFQVKGYM
jgi:hypothetical protein